MRLKFLLLVILQLFVVGSLGYDLKFNTDKDLSQWKLNGSYIYSQKIPTLASLLPASLVASVKSEGIATARMGVWLLRYSGPDTENYLNLHYGLKHHLFQQGLVHFIAHPSVPLTVTTNNGQEVGKFWSDGKTWCDAIFNINLQNQVDFHMETSDVGRYILVDKIILGVMNNLTTTRVINPCLTSAPSDGSLGEDDMAPDMARKPEPPQTSPSGEHTPPDMISKPENEHSHHHHLQGGSGGMPDMANKSQGTNLETLTMENSSDSDVKCGCTCNCSRKKTSANNATSTVTG